jgi:hypothetical protein
MSGWRRRMDFIYIRGKERLDLIIGVGELEIFDISG